MKLGPIRVTIYNLDGEEISRQIYDLSKSKGSAHFEKLWRWALHQGHSFHVSHQQPATKGPPSVNLSA